MRVVTPNGKHEVLSIQKALEMAESFNLDLVEIAPNASPPVCRIIDFGKLMYNQKKKEKRVKDKQQVMGIKEIRLRPYTEEHDFMFKIRHSERFLKEGSKVRVSIQFRGRDIIYSKRGEDVLNLFAQKLDHCSSIDQQPKLEGKRMGMVLIPMSKK